MILIRFTKESCQNVYIYIYIYIKNWFLNVDFWGWSVFLFFFTFLNFYLGKYLYIPFKTSVFLNMNIFTSTWVKVNVFTAHTHTRYHTHLPPLCLSVAAVWTVGGLAAWVCPVLLKDTHTSAATTHMHTHSLIHTHTHTHRCRHTDTNSRRNTRKLVRWSGILKGSEEHTSELQSR